MRKPGLLPILAALTLCTVVAAEAATPARPAVVTDNNASCDIGTYPAATLLLPYFEVDFKSPATTAQNTVFSVINTSPIPQMVRVTIWTDLGFPASWFNMFLSGYDAQTVSLYEVLARGNFPVTGSVFERGAASADNRSNPNFIPNTVCDLIGGTVPASLLERIQRCLSTGVRDEPNCRVGLRHDHAVGYVTIDVINSCSSDSPTEATYWNDILLFDNVLTGDYERVNPDPGTGNYAGGNPLVHIRAIPGGGAAGSAANVPLPYTFYDRLTPAGTRKADRRQPLPSTFSVRYIQGGPTSFQTNLAIWREGLVGATREECAYSINAGMPLDRTRMIRFDEHENATTLATCAGGPCPGFPVVSSTPSNAALLPPMATPSPDLAGWFSVSLDNGGGRLASSPYSSRRASQNWVVVQMYAEGRYGVDFDATWMANGCTPQ